VPKNILDEELSMRTIKFYQEQAQKNVDKLITVVEMQYNALSSVTFTYAGKITNVLTIKSNHDKLSYMAYGNAHKFNALIGKKMGELIVKFEKPQKTTTMAKVVAEKTVVNAKTKAMAAKKATAKFTQKAMNKAVKTAEELSS
jgi:hypothetical protein